MNLLDYKWHTEGRIIFADLTSDASLSESFVGIMDDADLASSICADHNYDLGISKVTQDNHNGLVETDPWL